MFTKQLKSKGACDRCQMTIYESDEAICFHTDAEELYLCGECVEIIREEFMREENIQCNKTLKELSYLIYVIMKTSSEKLFLF